MSTSLSVLDNITIKAKLLAEEKSAQNKNFALLSSFFDNFITVHILIDCEPFFVFKNVLFILLSKNYAEQNLALLKQQKDDFHEHGRPYLCPSEPPRCFGT